LLSSPRYSQLTAMPVRMKKEFGRNNLHLERTCDEKIPNATSTPCREPYPRACPMGCYDKNTMPAIFCRHRSCADFHKFPLPTDCRTYIDVQCSRRPHAQSHTSDLDWRNESRISLSRCLKLPVFNTPLKKTVPAIVAFFTHVKFFFSLFWH